MFYRVSLTHPLKFDSREVALLAFCKLMFVEQQIENNAHRHTPVNSKGKRQGNIKFTLAFLALPLESHGQVAPSSLFGPLPFIEHWIVPRSRRV